MLEYVVPTLFIVVLLILAVAGRNFLAGLQVKTDLLFEKNAERSEQIAPANEVNTSLKQEVAELRGEVESFGRRLTSLDGDIRTRLNMANSRLTRARNLVDDDEEYDEEERATQEQIQEVLNLGTVDTPKVPDETLSLAQIRSHARTS